jgi:NADPH2:quinone reductase
MKIQAVQVSEPGGPEALQLREATIDGPGDDELLIEHSLIAVNFIDTYHRSGLYPVEQQPFSPGVEAVGVVREIGDKVDGFNEGDRVAYLQGPPGSYASHRCVRESSAVKLPDGVDDEAASSLMVRGLTAWYLLHRTFAVQADHRVLIHAAAGGMGLLLGPWASAHGATVYGTASTDEKVTRARDAGYDEVIRYDQRSFVDAIDELTDGEGVHVVYDGVGKATFHDSLDCLKKRGFMVTYGNASGPVEAIEPGLLAQKGSLFLTRPSLFDYVDEPEEFQTGCKAVIDALEHGVIRMPDVQRILLSEAAKAHQMLENREVVGTVALDPKG